MRLGDLTVLIENGPRAVVAAVVRGKVPSEIAIALKKAVEEIHMRHGKRLADYSGDPDEYTAIEPTLRECLMYRRRDQFEGETPARKIPWLAIGSILISLAVFGYFGYEERQAQVSRQLALENLARQAGIVLTSSAFTDEGVLKVSGLRDPLAIEAELAVGGNTYPAPAMQFDFKPYISIEPEIVLIRANQVLSPPETVLLHLKGSILELSGEADISWLDVARERARSISGVEFIDVSALTIFDSGLMLIENEKKLIESISFYFERAQIEPLSSDLTIERLAEKINNLQQLYRARGGSVMVDIFGSADDTGTEPMNLVIERQRANYVFDALIDAGVSASSIRAHSLRESSNPGLSDDLGIKRIDKTAANERKVTLRVTSFDESTPESLGR
jgi:outer membrane protein OmpA-like peptidoglycan-associated protein